MADRLRAEIAAERNPELIALAGEAERRGLTLLVDEVLAAGDYSGPNGARTVLRDRRVQVGILEVARGGLLRRGPAVPRARSS